MSLKSQINSRIISLKNIRTQTFEVKYCVCIIWTPRRCQFFMNFLSGLESKCDGFETNKLCIVNNHEHFKFLKVKILFSLYCSKRKFMLDLIIWIWRMHHFSSHFPSLTRTFISSFTFICTLLFFP